MGMKDQFQDKSEQWPQQAKQKAQCGREGQGQDQGPARDRMRDEEAERLQREEQERLDPDYDM
jgi:hypothetical protein